MESDVLLGVHDSARIGAIRFATGEGGQFLSHSNILATPPMVRLRELEQSAYMWERSMGRSNEEKWLMQLIASGSSLGGARPKATVTDENGSMWIAKFPSSRDVIDKGAWEMLAHDLAHRVGITVPQAQIQRLSDSGTTYLSQRFDRTGDG
jgi:serine/threonine-protein kinase HipA